MLVFVRRTITPVPGGAPAKTVKQLPCGFAKPVGFLPNLFLVDAGLVDLSQL